MTSELTPPDVMNHSGALHPSHAALPATVLGGYTLMGVLGRGGMGVVYRALDRNGDACAVKVLAPEVTGNPKFLRRLHQEFSLGPKLLHPHIVEIREVGEADGFVYLVMPLIEGRNLKEMVDVAPLTPEDALRLLRPVAEALDCAHEVGVVHCDVKPQNILVQDDTRTAFISDFGLVRPAGVESTSSRSREIFGSVQYMAPEQIEGLPVDGRTDVYSLSCTLFEVLTGRIPYDRPNEVAVLWAHVNDPLPRVTDGARKLPGGLDDAVAKGMAKHPDDRYLTCGELIGAVDEALANSRRSLILPAVRPLVARKRVKTEREVWSPNYFPELARVRAASRTYDWRRIAAIITAAALTLGGATQVVHPQGLPGAATDVSAMVRAGGERFTDLVSGPEDPSGRSSDSDAVSRGRPGKKIPGMSSGGDEADLGDPRGTFARGPIQGSPLTGKETEHLLTGPSGVRTGIVFSRLVGDTSDIFLLDHRHELRNLTSNEATDSTPALSPDGRKIVFSSNRLDDQTDLYLMDLDGRKVQRITADVWADLSPAWSPDGDWLAYSSYDYPKCTVHCATGYDYEGDLRIVRKDGSEIRTLASTGDNENPDWSPSGKSIVFTRDGDLYTVNVDGSGFTRLTDTPGVKEWAPTWSPDGKKIAYGYLGRLRVINLETEVVTDLTGTPEGSDAPTWSPDGLALVFSKCTDVDCATHRLWTIELATRKQGLLVSSPTSDSFPHWGVIAK